jgi:glutamate racemase
VLGVFDSGLGGLTVVRNLRARLPGEDLIFFADQAHVPYGDRTDAELRSYLAANVAYLASQGVDAIVMGCNTTCAIGARYGWPDAPVPVLDLIVSAAGAVVATGAKRVGVLATVPTAKSGAYGDAIRALNPDVDVQEVAAPALVPLVESGAPYGPLARAAVVSACAPFAMPLDLLVLACTHFPLLDAEFAAAMPNVPRLDPAFAQADAAVRFADERGRKNERGTTRYLTSGDLESFRACLDTIVGPLGPHDRVAQRALVNAE